LQFVNFRGQTFQKCGKIVEADHFVSKCIETACECLQASTNPVNSTKLTKDTSSVKACKCSVLENYVTECMANDESVQLDTWRSAEDCEVKCAAPLVYKDCYRRRCEPSCDNIKTDDCPRLPGSCFPGCYCPEGLVKNGKKCTPASECRDCVCDGLSKAQYLTYDRRNFTVDGNCTYLLTRKRDLDSLHPFQVYTTIGPCAKATKASGTCTQALHIFYGSHVVHIQRGAKGEKPKILIDGLATTTASWLKLTEEKGMFYKLVIPESQLEITSSFDDMTFAIKVPSSKYGSKMEGLCGDCNDDPSDDLKPNLGKLQQLKPTGNAVKDFTMSWQSDDPRLTDPTNNVCTVEDVTDCMPLPPDQDPCFKILDEALFGKCHLLVDPTMYVSACQQDLCKLGPNQKGACNTMAAYARECARNGICLNWRAEAQCQYDVCPANLVYEPCGCAKTCEMVKKHLAQSSVAKGKSPPAFNCPIDKAEGCYCPKGKLLHNGKCIADAECNAPCDSQVRFCHEF
jgi:von Willebrand factor